MDQLFYSITGNPEVTSTVSRVTSRPSTPLRLSSIPRASAALRAMLAVAYASASIHEGAITVTERRSVTAGRPSTGLIVCHVRPPLPVFLKLR